MAHAVKSRDDWTKARVALLAEEKALTRARDRLAEARRALPWVKVEKEYRFTGPAGTETLADLFGGRSQLLVYHFMYGADWDDACPSCSFWGDNLNGTDVHLAHRDTTLLLVSAAPLEMLEAYKKRMGWRLNWVSSAGSDFNRDFGVGFTAEDLETGDRPYNYRPGGFNGPEAPGLSAFIREGDAVYHTYSTFGRGLDGFNGAYQLLDLTAKGRDEDNLDWSMQWLRRRDQY